MRAFSLNVRFMAPNAGQFLLAAASVRYVIRASMDTATLQQWLSAATRKPIRVIVTENRSLLLSFKRQPDGNVIVRLHRMFLDAPQRVHQGLADWIQRRRGQARSIIR